MKNGRLLSSGKARNISNLAQEILEKRKRKSILLMAHQIVGYPDFETNYEMIRLFHECGVNLVELQIPFSEPIADGPLFLKANQKALERGTTVEQCLDFAQKVTRDFPLFCIFMTYYNILLQYGVKRFVETAGSIGIRGLIVPDAFPEESDEYFAACKQEHVDPILVVTPYTPDTRMEYLAGKTEGLLYCAARKGVTGSPTSFGDATTDFLLRCRQYSSTPIAVGFGIQRPDDVRYLVNKSDIAIVGSTLLNVLEAEGTTGVRKFLLSLRPE
ncbi:tryptophan synthase alpha chain [Ktedonobacter sp. SOSP1-52]|uniref:tryptophan synthase subunit alpha n=1 Tax=Ktedonobacter sp. SOSP1-52 TaxID=2778366 RepID=UPI001916848A|nr:tryptophan synthase subunit alpha [Ktedonobacter sp. SOSP1-52]GHO70287.1 tryptophan synthase alpha chain [Ktedonobacter sp. SOSP1-52]